MFDVRIATSSNIIDKIRKLQTKMAAKELLSSCSISSIVSSSVQSLFIFLFFGFFLSTDVSSLPLLVLLHCKWLLNRLSLSFLLPHHWKDYLQCPPYSKISLFLYSVFETKTFEL